MAEQWKQVGTIWEKIPAKGGGGSDDPGIGPVIAAFIWIVIICCVIASCSK